MKRRVVKTGNRRYRVELPGGDLDQFSYREKPRKWDAGNYCHIEFKPGEDRYILSWDGVFLDTFLTEVEVLLFIIRFGYSIGSTDLVPSEILTDFQLAYEAGDWVDEWGCLDQHEVVFVLGEIQRPAQRNIRFEGYPRITPKVEKTRIYSWDDDDWKKPEIAAEIEIPKLNFEELEKPRRRRRTIRRDWSDHSDTAYGGFMVRKGPPAAFRPDVECVFTLEIGKAAEKAHQARKKKASALRK